MSKVKKNKLQNRDRRLERDTSLAAATCAGDVVARTNILYGCRVTNESRKLAAADRHTRNRSPQTRSPVPSTRPVVATAAAAAATVEIESGTSDRVAI